MQIRLILPLLIVLITFGCATKKKEAELLELSKPQWLKERPMNSGYYYGIGITTKVGSPLLYEDKAKERALADISSQINTRIESEANFYKVEDNSGVKEYIQSRIKATSGEFLEGYEYIDKWQDDKNVYAFYQLSKQKFQELKQKRKSDAISNAELKYLEGIKMESNGEIMGAITQYASAIDVLSGYMDQEVSTLINGEKTDLITSSRNRLLNLIQSFDLYTEQNTIQAAPNQNIEEGTILITVHAGKNLVAPNVPVNFKYSGGFLMNELAKSDATGRIASPPFKKSNTTVQEALTAEIDVINIARQVTKNLYVRKLIEKENGKKLTILVL